MLAATAGESSPEFKIWSMVCVRFLTLEGFAATWMRRSLARAAVENKTPNTAPTSAGGCDFSGSKLNPRILKDSFHDKNSGLDGPAWFNQEEIIKEMINMQGKEALQKSGKPFTHSTEIWHGMPCPERLSVHLKKNNIFALRAVYICILR